MPVPEEAKIMVRALQLARRGCYTTDPNPRVGCVIVSGGIVVGEGWHRRAGGKHAEVLALEAAGGKAAGATAFVTLEPCSHHGRTPPCCDALIEAGVARVVAAMPDPNPMVSGSGLKRLEEAGIEVACGLLRQDAEALNAGFISRMTLGRPYITGKIACSMDGRSAMASGESRWITSSESRRDVHQRRAASSAVLTGIGTVLADDPRLNARLETGADILQPLRVVLDSSLRMPTTAAMLKTPGITLVLTTSDNLRKKQALERAGAEVQRLPQDSSGKVDVDAVMQCLSDRQINEVLVEAGPGLNGALLRRNLVDEWLVYMAPHIMGDRGQGLFSLCGLETMADRIELKLIDSRRIGPDLRMRFKIR
ncbi:MAG: bifunctional diaminohydroxyphosphoribosylaminopyrimidine deaminase/5-amino-6-(5-phosphoribosylamino)uracil reductase RibD [Gammaproteobacteria bacterium]